MTNKDKSQQDTDAPQDTATAEHTATAEYTARPEDAATPQDTEFTPSANETLSDIETLMLGLEGDPWLNPSGGMVTVMDRPVDQKHFRRAIKQMVAQVPALRKRIVPAVSPLSAPAWETDPEFDFDYHLQASALPSSACEFSDLLKLATWQYQRPYDTTRPLWQVITIENLQDGRAAIIWRMHHTIGDATTMMRMSEHYMQLERRSAPPKKVDLEAIFAAETEAASSSTSNPLDAFASAAAEAVGTIAKKQGKFLRQAAGEVLMWGADPVRAKEFGQDTITKATTALQQLSPSSKSGGSDLWKQRSRHRSLESLQLPLDEVKAAAKVLGGSINDFFVVGAVMGSLAYHDNKNAPVDSINLSFVVSTRGKRDSTANAFSPMPLQAPAGAQSVSERFTDLQERMAAQTQAAKSGVGLANLAGVLNLLPSNVVASAARSQAASQDFATSNFRGAPVPVFVSGAKLLHNVPFGPVAGTAFNITVMSYNNSLDFGLLIDPSAVEDPRLLRDCMVDSYQELLSAGAPDDKS